MKIPKIPHRTPHPHVHRCDCVRICGNVLHYAQVNDYEEDNAEYGTESIGKIAAHLKARDIGLEDLRKPTDDGAPPVPNNFTTITPLGMISHKKSLITNLVTCMKSKFSSKNLIFFI